MSLKIPAGVFLLLFLAGGWAFPQNNPTQNNPTQSDPAQSKPKAAPGAEQKVSQAARAIPGNEACAACHAEIYKSYMKTVMATASGPASEGFIGGEFTDKISGVKYKIFEDGGRVRMSYERPGDIKGERDLPYYIGSGVKGRTYLFSINQFWFEAPVNWYSQEKRWNMTPAYTEAKEMPNLPAYADCMNCHASGLRPPLEGTDNKYVGAPFEHPGITCERCHGAGERHGKDGGGAIVNPAKLEPDRRDAICMECHFEGTVAVEQPGKHPYDFQPGERLSDYIHYFVLSENDPVKPQALSQFEALAMSACKRSSGEKMWCGSCHDPHVEPSTAEKAAYYRAKCVACHGEEFAAKHHPQKPGCTGCHMPELPSKDVAHTEGTDHRIRRYPSEPAVPRLAVRGPEGAPLLAFPAGNAGLSTTRDFALGWETLAQRNVEDAARQAEQFLGRAMKDDPNDAVLLSAEGYVELKRGHDDEATQLYERALNLDPLANDAAANLGILEARTGNLKQSVKLWQEAFARVPHRSAIGLDLAMVFCAAGQKDDAKQFLQKTLEFNPDYLKGKQLLEHLKANTGQCKP